MRDPTSHLQNVVYFIRKLLYLLILLHVAIQVHNIELHRRFRKMESEVKVPFACSVCAVKGMQSKRSELTNHLLSKFK